MNSDPKNIILRAKEHAREVHQTLIFPTTSGYQRPQSEHLQEVADLVWIAGGSDTEIAAAWLHDSVEDTPTVIEDIEKTYGKEVATIVHGLTDGDDIKDLPTLERKKNQAERVKAKSESVRKIKIADQISNVRTVTLDPPDGWSFEKNRDYVIGAKLIADQCKGISPLLDQLFDQEYAKAITVFKI